MATHEQRHRMCVCDTKCTDKNNFHFVCTRAWSFGLQINAKVSQQASSNFIWSNLDSKTFGWHLRSHPRATAPSLGQCWQPSLCAFLWYCSFLCKHFYGIPASFGPAWTPKPLDGTSGSIQGQTPRVWVNVSSPLCMYFYGKSYISGLHVTCIPASFGPAWTPKPLDGTSGPIQGQTPRVWVNVSSPLCMYFYGKSYISGLHVTCIPASFGPAWTPKPLVPRQHSETLVIWRGERAPEDETECRDWVGLPPPETECGDWVGFHPCSLSLWRGFHHTACLTAS